MHSLHDTPGQDQLQQPDIPEPLRSRLAAEHVVSLRQWAQLSKRRKRLLFGITDRHRRVLDELARGRGVSADIPTNSPVPPGDLCP